MTSKDTVEAIPMINGLGCPACGHPTLILGMGGFVTCSYIECPNPDYAEAIAAHTRQEVLKAERRGEYNQIKMLLHWSRLHKINITPEDLSHILRSLEQTPDQPLARQTLAALHNQKGET